MIFEWYLNGQLSYLSQSVESPIVTRLLVQVSVEQADLVAGSPPRVGIADTPAGNTNALGNVQARPGNVSIVGGASILDVKFGDGDFGDARVGKSGEGTLSVGTHANTQVSLGSDTVDGDALGSPLPDLVGKTDGLGIRSRVLIIQIQVKSRAIPTWNFNTDLPSCNR